MSLRVEAYNEFCKWLPGELEYSRQKASYDAKIERAAVPINHPTESSIYSFLSTEWFHFQDAKANKFYHSPNHAKSAQLQIAKFAAGVFDKALVVEYIEQNKQDTVLMKMQNFKQINSRLNSNGLIITSIKAGDIIDEKTEAYKDAEFENSFGPDIVKLSDDIVTINDMKDEDKVMRKSEIDAATERIIKLGISATNVYVDFAHHYLSADQLKLPESVLEKTNN